MSRRAVTLLIASVGVAGSLLVAALVAVPYGPLPPGPTYNTLGPLNGKPIVAIQGRCTYAPSGHLNMVTVSFYRGPGASPPFNKFAALQVWLSPFEGVVPQAEIFPPGQPQQQLNQQDT